MKNIIIFNIQGSVTMSEIKIDNLEKKKTDIEHLVQYANNICAGIPSIINNNDNMTDGLFAEGKLFYLNPTEELRMGDFIKKGEPVATVLSSGDFAIDSIFNGASDVLTFDINRFQFYPAALKLKFIQNMEYEDYCSFFSDEDNDKFMSLETYNYIKTIARFDKDLYTFMDIIFKEFSKARKNVRKNIKQDFLYQLINEINNGSMFKGSVIEEIIKDKDIQLDENVTDLFLNYTFSTYGFSYEPPEVLQLMHGLMTHKGYSNYLRDEETYNKTKSLIQESKIKFINCDITKEELILPENFVPNIIIVDPPFFKMKLIDLYNCIEKITKKNRKIKLVFAFIIREDKNLLNIFKEYKLRLTKFKLEYRSYKSNNNKYKSNPK